MTASTLTSPVQDAHFGEDHHPKLGVHRPRLKAMQPSELAVHKARHGKPRSNKSMRRGGARHRARLTQRVSSFPVFFRRLHGREARRDVRLTGASPRINTPGTPATVPAATRFARAR